MNPTTSTEYRNTSVYVTSTHTLQTVTLTFSDNSTKVWNSPGGKTGTFSNGSKVVTKVVVKSNNVNRTMDFPTNSIDTVVKNCLGITNVTYPYSGGSWQEYIDWCQSSSEQNASKGGYQWKFGGMSLVVYWLENYPSYAKNNALWKTHAQPVKAAQRRDRGLHDLHSGSRYQRPRRVGGLQRPQRRRLFGIGPNARFQSDLVESCSAAGWSLSRLHEHRRRFASARLELNSKERRRFKMVVLMTDGLANWVNGSQNTTAAKNYLLSETTLCAQKKYPILTVSLGGGADTSIMQTVADMTPKGKHFNIPGGQTGDEYYEDLLDVFKEIAKDRPLKLVK